MRKEGLEMAWMHAGELHQALEAAKLPIAGVAYRVDCVHDTPFAATFLRCGTTLCRIDWKQRPSDGQKQVAAKLFGKGCEPACDAPEVIDSSASTYPADLPPTAPRKVSEVVAFYLFPRAWIGERPVVNHHCSGLDHLFDEVHRQTLESGIETRILRVGIFVFDFSKSDYRTTTEHEFSSVDEVADLNLHRLAALNAYLLCLNLAFTSRTGIALEKQLLRPADLILPDSFENAHGYAYQGRSLIERPIPSFHELKASFFQHSADGDILRYNAILHWGLESQTRPCFDFSVLRDSFVRFDGILKHPTEHALLLVSLIAQASKACEDFDYGLSLISAWAVTEKLLTAQWRTFLVAKQKEKVAFHGSDVPLVDGKRKERLLNHRSYTSSVIAEFLTFQGGS
jgi:hypothetical protein